MKLLIENGIISRIDIWEEKEDEEAKDLIVYPKAAPVVGIRGDYWYPKAKFVIKIQNAQDWYRLVALLYQRYDRMHPTTIQNLAQTYAVVNATYGMLQIMFHREANEVLIEIGALKAENFPIDDNVAMYNCKIQLKNFFSKHSYVAMEIE